MHLSIRYTLVGVLFLACGDKGTGPSDSFREKYAQAMEGYREICKAGCVAGATVSDASSSYGECYDACVWDSETRWWDLQDHGIKVFAPGINIGFYRFR